MRASPILILVILAALPASTRAAQQPPHPAYTLVLRSVDLPEKDRQNIRASINVSACPPEVVSEIVLQKVRDLGYLQAELHEQKQQSDNRIQLTEDIKAGIRYKLRTMSVVKATVFPADQLRKEVRVAPGDVVSVSEITNGVEQIRELYASKGYINTVITPGVVFDSRQGLVDFILEVDEGLPHRFGALLLNGVEPHTGVAKQLWASFEPLRGQLYSPSAIDQWLESNKTICPSCKQRDLTFTQRNISSSENWVDVTLTLPPHPLQ